MSLLRPTFSSSTLTPESSQNWSQNTSKSNPEDGLRTVTIKQLLSAYQTQQGTFCIDQHPLGKFILVANVYKNYVISSKCRIFYGFDDGSGRISGFKTDPGRTFAPFAYTTIVGELFKDYDSSIVVKVSYILPVTDPHQIYYHILHVIFDDLRYEKGNPRPEDWPASRTLDQPEIQDLVSAINGINIASPLSELEQDIVDCIVNLKEYWEAHDDIDNLSRGIQIGSLVREVAPSHRGKVAEDFLDAIERLLAMRVLRTTVDEHHVDFC